MSTDLLTLEQWAQTLEKHPDTFFLLHGDEAICGPVLNKFPALKAASRLIHADMHGWNLMWHNGAVSVFDFDDCGIGLPIQDLYTALYYLDTDEQDAALKAGYESVRPIPDHTEFEAKALLLQRRIILLNYLFETSTPEHREILPKYQVETMRRINVFLENS